MDFLPSLDNEIIIFYIPQTQFLRKKAHSVLMKTLECECNCSFSFIYWLLLKMRLEIMAQI